ncbi:NADH-quinone oxidoreductase subunit G [Sulfobacillus thermosulfidooxidans DSM 9293]|uniref:NADH-quinone oxidoreductase subunit G n=1 Tax=Sulfobacillus thermosulfidooxidans (strain DSM 9293 / VKM B-1269 / AT-1) TaxID=929705 RepID=A0A1W1WGB5_SULTA|nr:2Fe-2S iron-sulfur cluster-binding protein [Sulfobacillus thermosulfidooxidans]SMC05285.1 NADH-quinone oxidoreductase subunit G [Sulfobacillus thermosulfidooxidans DSM 9293]
MIRLTIDGQEVTVPEGTMIVDAAAKLGIDVPIYCYHQALGPLGACRMCLVQVEKMPKLVTGCTTAVAEGMVVHTKGDVVEKGRKGVLEFLLINHPLDCPVCDKGGECYLQDYTFEYGPGRGRFQEPKIQKVKDGPINEFVLIDQERCVLCQRCVRYMNEYVGEGQLLLEGRGVETVVTTVNHEPATSVFTGNVIDLCPVGALLSAPYHHKGRPWNIDRQTTICPQCPVGCASKMTTRESHIIRMEGRPIPERDWGFLCDRGRFGYDFGYHPLRVLDSVVHGESLSSAQAMRDTAEWMKETLREYGYGSIGFILGGHFTSEEAYWIKQFAQEVVHSPELATVRNVPGYLPMSLNGTFEDIAQSHTVVFVGVDPYEAVPVVHLKLRDRYKHFPALQVIGVGPRKLTRPTLPGENYIVPSEDEAVLFAQALFMAKEDDPIAQGLVQQVKDYPLPVSADVLKAFGESLLNSPYLTLLWDGENPEMEQIFIALRSMRENPTAILPTFGPMNWRGYEWAGIPTRYEAVQDLLMKAKNGEIRMLILWGADLLRDFPDKVLAKEALEAVDYVISAQIRPPLDMPYVDALLPVATWGEVEGTYVNMEGRIALASAGVQPPGQSRPTKTYLVGWARLFKQVFGTEDLWDLFDDVAGDLIPRDQDMEQSRVVPITRPASSDDPALWRVIQGEWVFENGLPSEILEPRLTPFIARIHPDEAKILQIPEEGGYVDVITSFGTFTLGVRPDDAIPLRTLWVPRTSHYDWITDLHDVKGLSRREEVKSL